MFFMSWTELWTQYKRMAMFLLSSLPQMRAQPSQLRPVQYWNPKSNSDVRVAVIAMMEMSMLASSAMWSNMFSFKALISSRKALSVP